MTKQHSAHAHERRQRRIYAIRKVLRSVRSVIPNSRVASVVAICILVITGGIILFWTIPALGIFVSNIAAYPSVRSIRVYKEDADAFGGTLGAMGFFGAHAFVIPGQSTIYDYAERAGIAAAIIPGAMGEGQDIVLLGDHPKILTTDGKGKSALAVSSNGATIAYAGIATSSAHTLYRSELSAWHVYTIDLGTGAITDQGTGYQPQFFVVEGVNYLLFTSEAGVTVMNMDTHVSYTTPIVAGTRTSDAVTISADGTYLVVNDPISQNAVLLAIRGLSPDLRVSSLGSTGKHFDSFVAVGASLSGLTRTENGGTLWKLDPNHPGMPEQRYTFTNSFAPTRLLEN